MASRAGGDAGATVDLAPAALQNRRMDEPGRLAR